MAGVAPKAPYCGEYNRKDAPARQIYTIRRGRRLLHYHILGWEGSFGVAQCGGPKRQRCWRAPKRFANYCWLRPARLWSAAALLPLSPCSVTIRLGSIAAWFVRNTGSTQSPALFRLRQIQTASHERESR